jgi:glycosyltransferase involved in cell wall biosynthesis
VGEHLVRLGASVRTIAPVREPVRTSVAGVEYVGVAARFVSNWIKVPTLGAYRELERSVRWADVVHVHNPPEWFCFLASRLARRHRKPLVISVLSPGRLSAHPRRLYRALGSVDELFVTAQLRWASIVQVKNPIDESYVRSVTSRLRFLPDGVPDDFFEGPAPPPSLLDRLGWSGRFPVLLYLGRVHPMKGPDHFVRAAVRVRSEFPAMGALLAGPASEEMARQLESIVRVERAEGYVRILGPLSDDDRRRAFDGADVLVVPSLADFVEGFSMVSSEAWARGRPVAAYAVGALRARVREGENGALATPGDPAALAEAVKRALKIQRPVARPRDVVPWADVARTYFEWYSELTRGPRTPA